MICSASCICNWKSASYSLCIYYHDSPHKYHKLSKNTPDDNIYIIWCPGPTQLCHVPFFLPSAHPWIQNKKNPPSGVLKYCSLRSGEKNLKGTDHGGFDGCQVLGTQVGEGVAILNDTLISPCHLSLCFFFLLFPMIKAGNDISNKLPANSVAHIQGGIPTSMNPTFRVAFSTSVNPTFREGFLTSL